jgi:hypothetical protein
MAKLYGGRINPTSAIIAMQWLAMQREGLLGVGWVMRSPIPAGVDFGVSLLHSIH